MFVLSVLLSGCGAPPPLDRGVMDQTWLSESEQRPVRELTLTDHRGEGFGDAQLAGRWTVFAIGYTSCPDVCPTTLRALSQAIDLINAPIQPVFLAVDTERDRTALPNYAPFFHDRLLGVSGEPEAVQQAVDALGGSFEVTLADGRLQVDHATSLFLVDPSGLVNGYALRPSDPSILAADLTAAMDAWTPTVSMEGWIPPAPPSAPSLAAYGRLINHTAETLTLEAIESDDFNHAHAHETVASNGSASMNNTTLTIPPAGEFALRPGAHHLMLMSPKRDLKAGDTSVLRLRFSGGHDVLVALPVEEQ